jgi:hypothetical protein
MQENEINICESKFKNKMRPLGLISFLGNLIYVTNVKFARRNSLKIIFKHAHKLIQTWTQAKSEKGLD